MEEKEEKKCDDNNLQIMNLIIKKISEFQETKSPFYTNYLNLHK